MKKAVPLRTGTGSFTCSLPKTENQLGTAVGKKLGHAVLRNQVKRRMREVFRKEQARLKGKHAIVWVARHRLAHAPYEVYEEVFRRLARKAGLL